MSEHPSLPVLPAVEPIAMCGVCKKPLYRGMTPNECHYAGIQLGSYGGARFTRDCPLYGMAYLELSCPPKKGAKK